MTAFLKSWQDGANVRPFALSATGLKYRASRTGLQDLSMSSNNDTWTAGGDDLQTQKEPDIRNHGVLSLPLETLERILGLVLESNLVHQLLAYFNLTRVCHRFRLALVGNPRLRLWRVLDNRYCSEWRSLQLERSKHCPLTLIYSALVKNHSHQKTIAYWKDVTPHCSRWESVRIESKPVAPGRRLRFVLPTDLYLPMLTTLCIYNGFRWPLLPPHADVNKHPRPSCSWRMPKLKSLTGNISIFALTLINSPLQSLELSGGTSAIFSLLTMLVSDVGKGLKQLCLTYTRQKSNAPDDDALVVPALTPIFMPNLDRIELAFARGSSVDYVFRLFTPYLRLPNTSVVTVKFGDSPSMDDTAPLKAWLSRRDLVTMRNLNIRACVLSRLPDNEVFESEFRADFSQWTDCTWARECRPSLRVDFEISWSKEGVLQL